MKGIGNKKGFADVQLDLIVIENDVIATSGGFDGPIDDTWLNKEDDGGLL